MQTSVVKGQGNIKTDILSANLRVEFSLNPGRAADILLPYLQPQATLTEPTLPHLTMNTK
jgi:hypothetical protein